MKNILLTLLIIIFPCLLFGNGYRDEFYIENRTDNGIVIVFETIGILGAYLVHNIDNETTAYFKFLGLNDSQKRFRTIETGEKEFIGYSQYDDEDYRILSPTRKFSGFFNFIFIFNTNGDLLCRIDNFNNAIIEDHTTNGPGMYVLVIN